MARKSTDARLPSTKHVPRAMAAAVAAAAVARVAAVVAAAAAVVAASAGNIGDMPNAVRNDESWPVDRRFRDNNLSRPVDAAASAGLYFLSGQCRRTSRNACWPVRGKLGC